jgi:predicted DNA-binding transcriptional regulator YafY
VLETSARLLRLLSILQSRPEWSATDLADRLDITPRTVRRDVDRLRALGYRIEARSGVGGGYRLGWGSAMPPLLLDDEEAVAVAVGLRSAALSSVAGVPETAVRALAKLEQVLPSRVRHRVQALAAAIVPLDDTGAAADPDVLSAIASAVRENRRLRVTYRRHDGDESRRELEPHRIVHAGRRWYLVAWDAERADWRTFRVDRLAVHQPPGARFTPRAAPAADLAGWTAEGLSARPYRYRCRITVHAPADVVRQLFAPTVAAVTALGDDTCLVVCGANSLEEVAVWMGLCGHELTVHEPDALRDVMTAIGDRLRRAGAQAGGPD